MSQMTVDISRIDNEHRRAKHCIGNTDTQIVLSALHGLETGATAYL
jgi:hypothetical protein